MKQIYITQRVAENQSYPERRDCLDQRWFLFFNQMSLIPIIVPNNLNCVIKLLDSQKMDGLLLTGGNNIDEDAPERDEVERYLLKHAINQKITTLGICRGMQLIQSFFGVHLKSVTNHVGVKHRLTEIQGDLSTEYNSLGEVNSFHRYGSEQNSEGLMITSKSLDGVIMSMQHNSLPLYGQMWHPERETSFHSADINIFKKVFKL